VQRTISTKIQVPADFLQFLQTCNTIYNRYVDWCFATKSYSKTKAHRELYSKFKAEFPNIPTSLLQTIRDNALESVKSVKFKFKPNKKPYSHVRYDARAVSLRGNLLTFSFWLGQKRIRQIVNIPSFFKKRYANWKFKAATIGYDKLKKCFKANLIFYLPDSKKSEISSQTKIVGVDRGLYNIVSLSDGFRYASKEIRKTKRKTLFLRKQLQAKGTPSAKRKLKALSGYEKRFSLNINHNISKQLANMPYDIFVLENLSGIRQRSRGKILNKWLSNWSFWQLEKLLKYKAEALGKQIVKVEFQIHQSKVF